MFTAEVSQRTKTLKTALLRAVAAAFATIVTVQMIGVALHRMQVEDQRGTMVLAMELLGQSNQTDQAAMMRDVLTPAELVSVDSAKLRQMLGSTLDYFVELAVPARASAAIELALRTADSMELTEPTKLALANELNAALLFEDLLARIEVLNIEKKRRIAFAEIG